MRLFVAQIAILIENKWFDSAQKLKKSEKSYAVHSQLFAADDEEAAFAKVQGWIDGEGFSDSNHDGPGDLTEMSALGIHQIEEIVTMEEFEAATKDIYGVSLPVLQSPIPPVVMKDKSDLEIFLQRRFTQGYEGFADY